MKSLIKLLSLLSISTPLISNSSILCNFCDNVELEDKFFKTQIITTKDIKNPNQSLVETKIAPDISIILKKNNLTKSNILAISGGIIVSTKGIFNRIELKKIANNTLNNLTKDDILAISDYIIATTKGIFTNKGIQIGYKLLSSPTKNDILAISNHIIVTNKGIFNHLGTQIIPISTIITPTKNNILAISDHIIATTKGIFNVFGQKIASDILKNPKKEDILNITNELIITSKGTFDNFGNQKNTTNSSTNKKNFPTKTKIASDILSNLRKNNLREKDILKTSTSIIATSKGVFDRIEFKQIAPDILINLRKNEILGLSDWVIVTTKGVFNVFSKQLAPETLKNLKKEDILNITNELIITSKGTFDNFGNQKNITTNLTKKTSWYNKWKKQLFS